MEVLKVRTVVEKDGEIRLTGLPYGRGDHVDVTLQPEPEERQRPWPTARDLLESGLVGMWKDRQDIEDSSAYARRLREKAQRR